MAKREFAHPNEMHKYVGQEIGVSDWVEVSQDRINQFAEATGDHQWIHVDVERAKKDMPGGKTIAHGFLTLSLIPMLNHQISHINNVRNGINYGCNKVRFTSPVPAGSRGRARAKLIAADPMNGAGGREGIAYRLAPEPVKSELAILWNREMLAGIYRPQWVPAKLRDGRTVTAVTFEVDPEHSQYCGNLPIETQAHHMAFAEGRRGT